MKLAGLSSLAKTVNQAMGKEAVLTGFEEEFELLFQATGSRVANEEDAKRHIHEMGNPYSFHPSNLGACARCVFYNFLKYEPEPGNTDCTLADIQDYGTDRHERVQRRLINMPPAFVYINPLDELERIHAMGINTQLAKGEENSDKTFGKDTFEYRFYNPDIPLWFRTDGIFSFKGIKGIFEFKTELSFKFQKRAGPEPTHIDQATWYADMFGLDYILFMYEYRGELFDRKRYLIKVDPERVKSNREKARYIILHVENNELPPKEEDKKKCQSSYCKHHAKCAQDCISQERYETYLATKDILHKKALGMV